MNRLIPAGIVAVSLILTALDARAAPKVVASIKPIHSLVAGVMDGIGTPALIVEGGASPHTYSLKPSQAAVLQGADMVFWVGGELESFLEKPIATIAAGARSVELAHAPGLTVLEKRAGGSFEAHRHDEHGDHEHGGDLHIWLDPENAKAMVRVIAGELMQADAANAQRYRRNADALLALLDGLRQDIAQQLAPVRNRPFVVFHDGYQYFEHRFGLAAAGSITVSPEVIPGAERIREIQARIVELNAACVFTEPQFQPKLVRVATEGTRTKTGVLDPLGAGIADGPALYFTLLRNMAASVAGCLAPGR